MVNIDGVVAGVGMALLLINGSCASGDSAANEEANNANTLASRELNIGQALSQQYCSGCHRYTEPALLPKAVWTDVLTDMGHRLGVYQDGLRPDSLMEGGTAATLVKQANVYPEQPVVSKEVWQAILDYYQEEAPETIEVTPRGSEVGQLTYFTPRPSRFSQAPPLTNLIKIIPGEGVIFSDGKRDGSSLNKLNQQLKREYDIRLPTTPVHYREKADTIYLTTIGRKMLPSDQPGGAVQQLFGKQKSQPPTSANLLLRDLQRPVYTAYADLNQDGWEDMVVCEFGNLTGKLAWYEKTAGGQYISHVLKQIPGATRVIIRDINNDDQPDLLVLMAQGDEGIYLFTNQAGQFSERRLLRFPPVYGSTYFDILDFNQDGHFDILYTCGDNADRSPVLKGFHGIYLFAGDGNLNFDQEYFFPLPGAYKALAEDYDQDGDLDIAAISFFPDYQNAPEESFIFLENQGDYTFEPATFAQATLGRWIVMDANDIDQDGDIDIALGSFVGFLPEGDTTGLYEKWLKNSPSVLLLENTIR